MQGCTLSDTFNLNLSVPGPGLGQDTAFCAGESAWISVSGFGSGYGFQWNTSANTAGISVSQSGTYAVTVTELSSGCTGTDALQVTVNPAPVPVLPADTLVCDRDSASLDPGNFVGYEWSTGSTAQVISVNGSGTYSVTVSDGNGCRGFAVTKLRMLRTPEVSLGPDLESCDPENFELSVPEVPGDLFQWSTGSSQAAITASESGIYWVEVSNECGSDRDSLELSILSEQYRLFVPTAFSPSSNYPENRFFHASGIPADDFQLKIYNRWGALVYASSNFSEGWDGSFEGKPAEEGVYVYTMTMRGCNGKLISRSGTVMLLR